MIWDERMWLLSPTKQIYLMSKTVRPHTHPPFILPCFLLNFAHFHGSYNFLWTKLHSLLQQQHSPLQTYTHLLPHATFFSLFSFSFYFLPKHAPPPTIWSLHTSVFKHCHKVLVFLFLFLYLSHIYIIIHLMIPLWLWWQLLKLREVNMVKIVAVRAYWIEEYSLWQQNLAQPNKCEEAWDSRSRNCFWVLFFSSSALSFYFWCCRSWYWQDGSIC